MKMENSGENFSELKDFKVKLEVEEFSTQENSEGLSINNYQETLTIKEEIEIEDILLLDTNSLVEDDVKVKQEFQSLEKRSSDEMNGAEKENIANVTSNCAMCGYIEEDPYKMKDHINTHFVTEYALKYECQYCDHTSNSSTDLNQHIVAVHQKMEYKFEHSYDAGSNLNAKCHSEVVHYKKHKCELCDYASNRSGLRRHIAEVHEKIKNHNCQYCYYSAFNSSALKIHIDAVHLKIKNHKCEQCKFTASKSSDLKRHINYVHLKIKDHKCEHCDYATSKSSYLKKHVKYVHLRIKNHKCEQCKFTTSKSSDLKRHVNYVHLKIKDHKCEHCDYATSESRALRDHIKRIHLKNHKCEYCDFTTSEPAALESHNKRFHLILKNHKCEHCDFTTYAPANLQTHNRMVHLKIEDYKCEQGNYTTSHSGKMNKDIKQVHRKLVIKIKSVHQITKK